MSYDSYPRDDGRSESVPARVSTPRWAVDAGRYWAGVAATAAVAAVAAVVGVLIGEGILDLTLLPPRLDILGLHHHAARYAVAGAVLALVAGALLHLLLLSTPRPDAFFTWIVVLLTIAAALAPFALSDDLGDALATGVLNAVLGIAVLSLLRGVAVRTRQLVQPG